MTIFSTFFLRIVDQENVFYDILLAIFPTFCFLRIIEQENVFYDILERENAFLGYKNKNFKKSKN